MEEVKDIVNAVKEASTALLAEFASKGLDAAHLAILNSQIVSASGTATIQQEKSAITKRFVASLAANFDSLIEVKPEDLNVLDYGSLSLVEEDDLEAIIAMEGMISHSRNSDIQEYLCFTTRLDSLFYGTRIDESNNPMDPEQLGDAFKEALRPLGLASSDLLLAYRHFNGHVFHNLEKVLEQANQILIQKGVIPELDLAARNKKILKNKRGAPRPKADSEERLFPADKTTGAATEAASQQVLSVMQRLMHGNSAPTAAQGVAFAAAPNALSAGLVAGVPAALQAGMMVGSQKVELVANEQLLHLLNEIQLATKSGLGNESDGRSADAENEKNAQALDLGQSLGDLLQQKSDKQTLQAIDGQSSDIINLVTMLYETIWQDETVPIPIKELIGRTQITVLKLALQDPAFFDSETHPARLLINELATAGISWTEFDKLDQDPMYEKMLDLITIFVEKFAGDLQLLDDLLEEFKAFKSQLLLANQEQEKRLEDVNERQNRLDDIDKYVDQKIGERILDDDLHPVVQSFLDTHFHKFVVQVVLREGPGGISWKPVMNTIDVLLWTVQPGKSESDLRRFVKVNPRLMVNLGKALEVAGIEQAVAEKSLRDLQKAQEQCLSNNRKLSKEQSEKSNSTPDAAQKEARKAAHLIDLPKDDEHLLEIGKYPVGIWLEFQAEGDQTIRCTLAAKISSIDKYIFVNGQGVKVVEKSKMGLARELKAGTVKVISEGPLIDRAMESIIGKLRDGNSSATEASMAEEVSVPA